MRIVKGLEHLSYENWLKKLDLFSQKKRRFWGGPIIIFQYIKQAYKKDGEAFYQPLQ